MTSPVTPTHYPSGMTALLDNPTAIHTPRTPHWLGEPAITLTGPLGELAACIPEFDRVPFGVNPRLDMIVRRAAAAGEIPVPTAVVSKRYVLVQHLDVIDALVGALRSQDVQADALRCRMTITESGARVAMRVELPERFTFRPEDGHPMALTFECFHSVDGTVPLFAVMGWFRFVCRNGLVVGTTHARMRQQHRTSLHIEELEPLLKEGLEAAACERDSLTALNARPVSAEQLRDWVDGPLARAWGHFNAARVYSIARLGMDGEPTRAPRLALPHERRMLSPMPVPGARVPGEDAYAVAQALSWVASRRLNVAESLAWRCQIPELLAQLSPDVISGTANGRG